ncbi:hypothetical protein ADL15_47940 [Actinoplanes awajinensis subsp. mycoplanecinus]|uniref:Uncharacterized protein n=1 Tax=Actinoplanes awajinensis subsp. mycoplanecinus TaxID=135947 RepID=A0A101J975_9ACTN|nr:hypothetical protein ADL15_47940 [Actinoplanes awajinensis subsp. mycoplanecinus]
MGNSSVYRIHTGDDVQEALRMARRLLGLRSVGCCPQHVSATARTGSRAALDRYLDVGPVRAGLSVPADVAGAAVAALAPFAGGREPLRRRDGSGFLIVDLTPGGIEVLRGLPPMAAELRTADFPLPGDSTASVGGAASPGADHPSPGDGLAPAGGRLASPGDGLASPSTATEVRSFRAC